MPNPSFNRTDVFTPEQAHEIEQFISYLWGYLNSQHKDTGAHSTITVDAVDSDLIPVTNDTYDLGEQSATGDLAFRAWKRLYLTTALYWAGASQIANQHVASYHTELSGDDLEQRANISLNQTHTFKDFVDDVLMTVGGSTPQGTAFATSGVTIPVLGVESVAASSRVITKKICEPGLGFQSAIEVDKQTIANNGTYDLPGGRANTLGNLTIVDNTGLTTLQILLRSTADAVVVISNPTGAFSTVSGGAGTTNVFYNAGTTSYRIENQTGSSRTYRLVMVGTGLV